MRTFTTFFLLIFNPLILAQDSVDNFTTSINGTIISSELNPKAMLTSENQKYWCTYEVSAAMDEMRELSNLKLYQEKNLILNFNKFPGSDVSITNSGKLIFYNHSEHFNGILTLQVYSKEGNFIFKKTFKDADLFEISPSGEKMGVRISDGIIILSLIDGTSYSVVKGMQLAFSEDDAQLAVAQSNKVLIYNNSSIIKTIQTGIELPRRLVFSNEPSIVAVIDKFELKVFSIYKANVLFENKVGGDLSYRDLKIAGGKIITGIHKRNKETSQGFLRIYDLDGKILNEESGESRVLKQFEKIKFEEKTQSSYDPVPWPFFPFDSMRTVWNHYEQHMGSSPSSSYLHQGLDLITPIGEPTYSVIEGYVKLVLTIGGASYWRTAISDTQLAGRSDGWLSAHLIESTIQFDIGDTVQIHDYLGDIIYWSADWGHIHFVNISDSGLVWYYNDGEWGINFNPSLVVTPYPDVTAPYIDQVFTWSKFGYAVNETSTYLQPDSLYGEIDIIVKVVDYVGDSEWQQPAYTTWYTIKNLSNGQIIKPKTLGHILNHKYDFYESSNYKPYAGVIYQRDNILLPSSWMDTNRNFYHNLTNSNGDSLIGLSEKALAFNTDNYPDGDYRIIVEVYDEVGNFDIDSMEVKFKNGNPVDVDYNVGKVYSFSLDQNYPNPFNPTTKIKYEIPDQVRNDNRLVTLKVYDVLGNEIATLINEDKQPGIYEIEFNGKELSSGEYFYQLRNGNFTETKKMLLIK